MNKKILSAAIIGSMFEWYDFYIFATLLMFVSKVVLPAGNDTVAFLLGLIFFAVGVMIRPLGALLLGRLGDLVGRKKIFLTTIIVMGVSTTLIGFIPGFALVGWFSPIALVLCRLGQGIALGGEYGNAVAYIYEHVKKESRGYYTGLLQTSVHLGLLLSFVLVLTTQWTMSGAEFIAWGWRIPFIFSAVLFGLSIWLRRTMDESPEFLTLKDKNQLSANPAAESFTNVNNLKHALLVTAGVTAGMSVVIYATVAYMIFYLLKVVKIDTTVVYIMLTCAQVFAIALTIYIGKLCDKISKLKILLVGLVLSAVTIVPLFASIYNVAHPEYSTIVTSYPVTLAGPENCSLNLFSAQDTSCSKVKDLLIKNNIPFASNIHSEYSLSVNTKVFKLEELPLIVAELKAVGYIATSKPLPTIAVLQIFLLICFAMVLHALTFAPSAALLGDLFPTKIRGTSISTVFHFSIGWFGGLLPFVVTMIIVITGNPMLGLYYPSAVAAMSAIVIAFQFKRLSEVRS